MAKKRKTTVVRVKKKKWFPIYASEHFNNVLLGETYINEESELGKKYLTANLSTITKSMRKQNINVQFKVDRVEDGKAYTKIIGYSMINAAVKRLVRRGRDKVADSFLAKTKNKEVLRVKPLIITNNKGTKALQTAIRLEARRVIREYIFGKDTKDVFADIVEGKLQKQIKTATAKLCPVKSCELRMVKLEDNAKVVVTDEGVKSEKVTIRKKDKGNQPDKPKKEKTQAEEYEDSLDQSSEDFGDDEVVANEDEFEENETVEEELERTTEEELDEEDEEMVTQEESDADEDLDLEEVEDADEVELDEEEEKPKKSSKSKEA